MTEYNHKLIDETIKAAGDMRISLTHPNGGSFIETPITLNNLIEYIHITGGCVSRHLNPSDKGVDVG